MDRVRRGGPQGARSVSHDAAQQPTAEAKPFYPNSALQELNDMIAQLDSKLVAQGKDGLITSVMKVLRVKSAPSGFTPNGWIPVPNENCKK